jgi:hypothetical protein
MLSRGLNPCPPAGEAVRENPRRFFVASNDDHVIPEIEQVLEQNERFWVVEKFGQSAAVAEKLAEDSSLAKADDAS